MAARLSVPPPRALTQLHSRPGGTRFITWSTCIPHPDHVVLPPVRHFAGLHTRNRLQGSSVQYPTGYHSEGAPPPAARAAAGWR